MKAREVPGSELSHLYEACELLWVLQDWPAMLAACPAQVKLIQILWLNLLMNSQLELEGCKDLDEMYRCKLPHFTFSFEECMVPFWSHRIGVFSVVLEMELLVIQDFHRIVKNHSAASGTLLLEAA